MEVKYIILSWLLLSPDAYATDVDLSQVPDQQKTLLKDATFSAKVRGMAEILGCRNENLRQDAAAPVFVVFVAEAKENLETRLLSIDVEITLSDGRVRRFDNVSFHLLQKGVQCDIRKVGGMATFEFPEDIDSGEVSRLPSVSRLRVLRAVFK